jgi:hypothetical protein
MLLAAKTERRGQKSDRLPAMAKPQHVSDSIEYVMAPRPQGGMPMGRPITPSPDSREPVRSD